MISPKSNKLCYKFVQSFTCEDASIMAWTHDLLMDWTGTPTHRDLAFQHAIVMAQHICKHIDMYVSSLVWLVMSGLPSAVYEHEVYHRDMPIIQDYGTHEKSWIMLNGFLNVNVQ